MTADFVYVRLHGSRQLYTSGYTDAELAGWADRIASWASAPSSLDVYVYFDNDAHGHAPHDARRLFDDLSARLGGRVLPGRAPGTA